MTLDTLKMNKCLYYHYADETCINYCSFLPLPFYGQLCPLTAWVHLATCTFSESRPRVYSAGLREFRFRPLL